MFKPIAYSYTPTEPELYYDSATRLYDLNTRTKILCYNCKDYRPTVEVEAKYEDVCYNWRCNKPIITRYWVDNMNGIVTEEMMLDHIDVWYYMITVERLEQIYRCEIPEIFKVRFNDYIRQKRLNYGM